MRYAGVIVLLFLTHSNVAYSEINPNPDVIGVYFDLEANDIHTEADLYSLVSTYLIITNPTAASIGGWECTLDFDMVGLSVLGGWVYSGSALNVLSEPEFNVEMLEPIPAEPETLLLSINLFVMYYDYYEHGLLRWQSLCR